MTRAAKVFVMMLMLTVCFVFTFNTTDCYAATSKTVATQSAFEKALKSKSIKTITVKTSRSKTITVPKGSYTTKSITINGSKVKFVNKGKIKNLTVKSAKSVTQYGTAKKITVSGKKIPVILKKGSKTAKVNNTKSGMRLMAFSDTDIEADAGADIILKPGAEDTVVDIDTAQYTSVVNYSKDNVTAELNDEEKVLKSGEVYYGGTMSSAGNQTDTDYLFGKLDGVHKAKKLVLEVNGYHGWYHNSITGTDYECEFVVEGNNVKLKHIQNTMFENKYLGQAEFIIGETTLEYVELISANDIYGDEGESYKLYIEDEDSGRGSVNPDNPLSIFAGLAGDPPVRLEIHGKGSFSNMSHGDSIHGWYYNLNTKTEYECVFEVNGKNVKAETIENQNGKNYLGDAEFEIVASDSNSVTLKSTNNVYGDEGQIYYFMADEDDFRTPINSLSPLTIFDGTTASGYLSLVIHGTGAYSKMSHGNSFHGWYQNFKTDTLYECRYNVTGNKVSARYSENVNLNKNYLGRAEFEIVEYSRRYVILKSINNNYGDEGEYYVFRNTGEFDSANPLMIFEGGVNNDELPLAIYGGRCNSNHNKGNAIYGRYVNPKTNTKFECLFNVDGNHINVLKTGGFKDSGNYLGCPEFEIVDYDSESVTIKSLNDIYGDKGNIYVLKPAVLPDYYFEREPDNVFTNVSGKLRSGDLVLEITTPGVYPGQSKGVHAWYHNKKTDTSYECRIIFDGDNMTVKNLENTYSTKNYLGDAEFVVVSKSGTKIVLRSINNIYGDEGTEYVLNIPTGDEMLNE